MKHFIHLVYFSWETERFCLFSESIIFFIIELVLALKGLYGFKDTRYKKSDDMYNDPLPAIFLPPACEMVIGSDILFCFPFVRGSVFDCVWVFYDKIKKKFC